MMLRRRMPRPTPGSTRTPFVVGPAVADDAAHCAYEARVGLEALRGARAIARQRVGEAGDSAHDILTAATRVDRRVARARA